MTVSLSTEMAEEIAVLLLTAAGAELAIAAIVGDHLVTSERCGLPSHGLLRLPQYIDEIEAGEIEPSRWPVVDELSVSHAEISGARCFGQVAGKVASTWVADSCRQTPICFLTARSIGHVGRIGSYVEHVARSGAVALAFCSGPLSGHRVAPFGSVDARLATNPIAYAFPTRDQPVVADLSTSVVPEGKVRAAASHGLTLVPGALQDANGTLTDDARALYASPPGTLLPLGGPHVGYKGTALAILVEVAATLLNGENTIDGTRTGNNLCIIGVSVPDSFLDLGSDLVHYIHSARPSPAFGKVLLPGEPERLKFAETSTIALDDNTWRALSDVAHRYEIGDRLAHVVRS